MSDNPDDESSDITIKFSVDVESNALTVETPMQHGLPGSLPMLLALLSPMTSELYRLCKQHHYSGDAKFKLVDEHYPDMVYMLSVDCKPSGYTVTMTYDLYDAESTELHRLISYDLARFVRNAIRPFESSIPI